MELLYMIAIRKTSARIKLIQGRRSQDELDIMIIYKLASETVIITESIDIPLPNIAVPHKLLPNIVLLDGTLNI